MNSYVELAQKTIEEFVKNGKILELPNDLPKEMRVRCAGVFVSIHKKPINRLTNQPFDYTQGKSINQEGELRGCIGTILPIKSCIAEEIIDNAIAACSQDYRFEPVRVDELDNLEISVDVLSEPELVFENLKANSYQLKANLDPQKYGVIVKSHDGRTGLLLPDLEGVETPDQQIQICRQKAGISPDEPINIYRFEVTRYKE